MAPAAGAKRRRAERFAAGVCYQRSSERHPIACDAFATRRWNRDRCAYGHFDRDGNLYRHGYCDSDGHGNAHLNADIYGDADGDSYLHAYSSSDAHPSHAHTHWRSDRFTHGCGHGSGAN
jgi:hypothetical protein